MAYTADSPAPVLLEPEGTHDRSGRRRLWPHVVAACVGLLAILPVVGWGSVASTDEGAAVAQAQLLSRTGRWATANPLPELGDRAFPIASSVRTPDGFVPYSKRALYPLLLAGLDRVGGDAAMFVLSIAGLVAAAYFAARIARRVDRRAAVATFWFTVVGTPLFFDAYVVYAHTLAAAAIAAGTYALLVAVDDRRPWALVGAGAAFVVAVQLRAEAVLVLLALAVVLAVVAGRRRSWTALAAAALAAGSAVVGTAIEKLAASVIAGAGSWVANPAAGDASWFGSRLTGLRLTLLGTGRNGAASVALLVGLVCIAVAGLAVRFRRAEAAPLLLGLGAVAYVAALFVIDFDQGPLRGLLVACPVLLFAFLAAPRSSYAWPNGGLVAAAGLFAIAVVLTQYGNGAGYEWGGRYFAIAIPLVAPFVVTALREALPGAIPSNRIAVAAGAGAVTVLALAVLAVGVIRHDHARVRATVAAVRGAAGGRPVLAQDASFGRLAPGWSGPALAYVPDDGLSGAVAVMARRGDDEVLLAGRRRPAVPGCALVRHQVAADTVWLTTVDVSECGAP